jgi:hypothetical protein
MAEQQRIWLQRLFINGNQIDNDAIVSSAYIEVMDTSGPLITLVLRDSLSIIRDDFQLTSGAFIECEFSDVQGSDPVIFKERFIAGKPKIAGEVITVDSFCEACHKIKQPATRPRFFNQKTPAFILAELCPGLKVQSDFPEPGTYHLNVGQNASGLLFGMARDYGACVFISRGTVYFLSLKKVMDSAPVYTAGRNLDKVDINIAQSEAIDNQAVYDRVLRRQYHCFDRFGQLHNSKTNEDYPSVVISSIPPSKLNNQSLHMMPTLQITSFGVGKLIPSMVLELDVVKANPLAERDHSVKKRLVIMRICHFSQGIEGYLNRMELGVLNGQ